MNRLTFNSGWSCRKIGDARERDLTWEQVDLPHDGVIGLPRQPRQFNGTKKAFFPNGQWEYVKAFEAPKGWREKTVAVEFEGVQNHAQVFLNGSFLGECPNGYREFTVCLDRYLKYGEKNLLRVLCKTGDDSRWYTGAGIYRNVNLLVANVTHIAHNSLRITTLEANRKSARLRIDAQAVGEARKIRVAIFKDGAMVAQGMAPGTVELEDPSLWCPEDPSLYTCTAQLLLDGAVVDEATERFGIRTLSVSAKTGLLINGDQVRLRGACIHHDNGVLGVATHRDAEFRRIRKLKEAGFNAIRSAHHPADRYLLDACDELGVLVMDEAFDCWHEGKSPEDYAQDFRKNWQEDITAMVEKDKNRPCVVMYSIGNEISDLANDGGVETCRALADFVKKLDPTRFTTVAVNGLLLLMAKIDQAAMRSGKMQDAPQKDINETMSGLDDVMERINNTPAMDAVTSGAFSAVDIAGYNYMHNRYEPDLEKFPDRVIVGSETYMKYIGEMWSHIENHSNVIGDFTWTGWDYLGETGIGLSSYAARDYHQGFYKGYPCISACCGDLDITGFRLPQSYYREIVFGLRKEPYLAVQNPAHLGETEYKSTWGWGDVLSSWSFDGVEGKMLTVEVYGRGEAELFLNGRSLGKQDCGKEFCCRFQVPYEKGVLEAVTEGGRFALRSAGEETRLSLWAEEKEARPGGLVFVNLAVTDETGTVKVERDGAVTLKLSGGRLLGFGSGNPEPTEGFCASTHRTYRGRAFAVIQAEKPGEIRICAACGEMAADITVPVKGG